ncbi:imidazole glycerol phosphate synthase subunit HisH [Lysobacter pythonis]|uniref:Imidazole glycerol phosphate synthase subunit HisH n=1 Tax=Solilutibacter pythonis TaxID=2483112 RepID=A0A3M2HM02_9GAMM|nr:imidazole glycerol phosphate synthase subunit HisH [Lysobacter pythonis]RMH90756.1 imidazole glycerol phosphate synthase subunit HisH [Lysobacter pythonis]
MSALNVALIDAGGANLGSVRYALERFGIEARLVRDGDEFGTPDRVVLPGVGAAATAMGLLGERGLIPPLRRRVAPLLGICLGMQLLFEHSEEGGVDCLGLLAGRVRGLTPAPGIRVPHMGWNRLSPRRPSMLLEGVEADAQAYFVHGYAAPVTADCIATTTHGDTFAAVVEAGNVCGMQFHPERSAAVGARMLANFIGRRS